MDQALWRTHRKTALLLALVFWYHNGPKEQLDILVEPNPVFAKV